MTYPPGLIIVLGFIAAVLLAVGLILLALSAGVTFDLGTITPPPIEHTVYYPDAAIGMGGLHA